MKSCLALAHGFSSQRLWSNASSCWRCKNSSWFLSHLISEHVLTAPKGAVCSRPAQLLTHQWSPPKCWTAYHDNTASWFCGLLAVVDSSVRQNYSPIELLASSLSTAVYSTPAEMKLCHLAYVFYIKVPSQGHVDVVVVKPEVDAFSSSSINALAWVNTSWLNVHFRNWEFYTTLYFPSKIFQQQKGSRSI